MKRIYTGLFLFVCAVALAAGTQYNPSYLLKQKDDLRLAATLDPTGFESPSAITCSYATSARTITLEQTGGVILWWRGTRYNLGTPWVSSAHGTGNGTFYLAARTSATPEWSNTVWTFDMAQIATIKVTASNTLAFRETHGLMPWSNHEEAHRNQGTYHVSGSTPTAGSYNVQPAVPADTDNFVLWDAGTIQDEDNPTTIPPVAVVAYTHLTFTGTGTAQFDIASNSLLQFGTTYPLINSYDSTVGTFTKTETVTGRYFNIYQILVPATADAESQQYRMLILQPQVAYTSLAGAQAEDFRSLFLGELSTLAPEFVAYTRLTMRTNAAYGTVGKFRIEAVSYLTGAKASQVLVSSVVSPSLDSLSIPNHNLVTVDAGGNASVSAKLDVGDNTFIGDPSGRTNSIFHVYKPGVAQVVFGINGNSLNLYDADSHTFRNKSALDRLVIDSSGNVGIGTSTPQVKTHSEGPVRIYNPVDSSQYGELKMDSGVYEITSPSTARFSGYQLIWRSYGEIERMRMDVNGLIGIGTSTPQSLLDVNGGSSFRGILNTNGNWISGDGGAEGIKVDSSGNVIINMSGVPEYADQAAAVAGGLATGTVYHNAGALRIVTP